MGNSISGETLDSEVFREQFKNRENGKRHHTSSEDEYQYQLLSEGDTRAIAESIWMWESGLPGHVCDDPVRNYKYLFVASIALASRAALRGGLDEETAYTISDIFIQKMDRLDNVHDILRLHTEMFTYYTNHVAELRNKNTFSPPVKVTINYIFHHLHENISMEDLADMAGLSASYLSTLFKKETGQSVTDYIISQKIISAKDMLRFSKYQLSEISSYLNFSSQSYFSNVFKKYVGCTPKQYRDNFEAAHQKL